MPVSAPARVRSNTRFLPGLRLTGDSALVKLKSSQSLPSSKDDMGESITTEVLTCDGVDRAAACSSLFFLCTKLFFFSFAKHGIYIECVHLVSGTIQICIILEKFL